MPVGVQISLFMISINLHLEFLYQKVHISSMLAYNKKLFSEVVVPGYTPQISVMVLTAPHIHPILLFKFLNVNPSAMGVIVIQCAFTYVSC